MIKSIKLSFGVAVTAAAILVSSSAFAADDSCKVLTDDQYQSKIQGNWHPHDKLDYEDKHYDIHLSFSATGANSGTFHSYLYEITDKNHMITVDGSYEIHAGMMTTRVTYSNLPTIEGQSLDVSIFCLTDSTLTVGDGQDNLVLDRV